MSALICIHDKMFTWSSTKQINCKPEQLEEFWKDETELRKVRTISFNIIYPGLKKPVRKLW